MNNFDDNNKTINNGAEPNGSANAQSGTDAPFQSSNAALNQAEGHTAENEMHSNGTGAYNNRQPQANPYDNAYNQPQANPYGNAYNQPQANPYGNAYNQPQANPYDNAYNQPQANPYGNAYNQPQANPYGNAYNQPQANPYGNAYNQPQANPYGNAYNQPQANPYGNAYNQPQLINGSWYHPNNKPPKTKMAAGLKVFIGTIIVLTVSFIGTFIWWAAVNTDNSQSDGNSFIFQVPTEEATTKKSDKSNTGKYADPNGPKITLKDNDTANGSTEKAYETLSESVVSVSVYDEKDDVDKAYPESEGSGIIISSNGYIVTNAHVINNATSGYKIKITKTDSTTYMAVVVGCDTRTDIAVLRCEEASNWKAAAFADSDDLKIGQNVVVIGNPGGSSYSDSLTSGIISALNRSLSGFACTYIQTDAAINPGNSGGPLANLNGQVVGITTVKVAATDYEGMGFAIPSKKVKEIANSIIKNGYVEGRVKLGIVCTELSSTLAKEYDIKGGIVVSSVADDSPLKNSKIKKDDIITAIDGKSITSYAELYALLDTYKPGDTVELTVTRPDNSETDEFTVTVTLAADNG